MKYPGLAVQDAVQAALTTAGLTAIVDPDENDALPYTVVGEENVTEGFLTTKTTDGARMFVDLTSHANTLTVAKQNADTGIQALTDRDNFLSITGHDLSICVLDTIGPIFKDDMDPNVIYYRVPYTIRMELLET